MCDILTLPRVLCPIRVTINGEPLVTAFPWKCAANETMGEDYDPTEAIMAQSIRQLLCEIGALFMVAKDHKDTVEKMEERFQEHIEKPWMSIIRGNNVTA